jgi:hypothetical protein
VVVPRELLLLLPEERVELPLERELDPLLRVDEPLELRVLEPLLLVVVPLDRLDVGVLRVVVPLDRLDVGVLRVVVPLDRLDVGVLRVVVPLDRRELVPLLLVLVPLEVVLVLVEPLLVARPLDAVPRLVVRVLPRVAEDRVDPLEEDPNVDRVVPRVEASLETVPLVERVALPFGADALVFARTMLRVPLRASSPRPPRFTPLVPRVVEARPPRPIVDPRGPKVPRAPRTATVPMPLP